MAAYVWRIPPLGGGGGEPGGAGSYICTSWCKLFFSQNLRGLRGPTSGQVRPYKKGSPNHQNLHKKYGLNCHNCGSIERSLVDSVGFVVCRTLASPTCFFLVLLGFDLQPVWWIHVFWPQPGNEAIWIHKIQSVGLVYLLIGPIKIKQM